jgi:hypothetical protein
MIDFINKKMSNVGAKNNLAPQFMPLESPKKLMGGRITHIHKMKPSLEGRSAHEDRT